MASTRFSRAGTTVNVTVPRSGSGSNFRRSTPHRTASRTRTLSSVHRPAMTTATVFKESNTPYLVGGLIAAGTLAYLLWPKDASAATPVVIPGTPGAPGGQGGQGGAGGGVVVPVIPASSFPQVQGASTGFAGPGTYRTTAPSGLRIRSTPSTTGEDRGLLPIGTSVQVVADAGNGWIQVSSPLAGFMCASCAQAPGGPWLVRQS